jgi:hypothetical protein
MRLVGLEIHRCFGEAAAIEDGFTQQVMQQLGRVDLDRDRVVAFAMRQKETDVLSKRPAMLWPGQRVRRDACQRISNVRHR